MIHTPRLTLLSEGNPFHRLLITSKGNLFVDVFLSHDTPRICVATE